MQKKLTEALAETDLSARQKRLLALCPGAGFGCLPPNMDKIIERVDCPTCSQILDAFDEIVRLQKERSRRVKEVCGPIRERNADRKREYECRKRQVLFGFLVRKPVLEAEPPCQDEEWCKVPDQRCHALLDRVEALKASCVAHWGDAANEEISRSVVEADIRKDDWMVFSFPMPK